MTVSQTEIGFASFVAVSSLVAIAAVLSNRLTVWLRIPAPALFLLAAAVVSAVLPQVDRLSLFSVRHLVTVALILVLFDGGMSIGWSKFRPALGPIVLLGVVGTLLTAAVMAVSIHYLFGVGWLSALLVGTALAPTDPAAVFSVLDRREVVGRSGIILQGEAGANDPVGVALMVGLLSAGSSGLFTAGTTAGGFALQMVVGGLVGLLGGGLMLLMMRRVVLPSEGLYPLQVLFAALSVYGLATLARGSGFLAVFVAGIMLGDARAPFKREIRRFHGALASFGEILAFSLLGLVVPLRTVIAQGTWVVGLALAVLLTFVVRPLIIGGLLTAVRLRWGERIFIVWSGLKGAMPILLGTFILTSQVTQEVRFFDLIFIVVAFSVLVQGSLVPVVARWCRVPTRTVPLKPWVVGIRLEQEPPGMHCFTVHEGAPAEGRPLHDLSRDEGVWISLVARDGEQILADGQTVLRAGDEVLVASTDVRRPDIERIFEGTRGTAAAEGAGGGD
ncbi:cation:proton antiporter [Micromonospora sp. NPDC007271]|uniref:cation:proton antiporter domain-containing protein n=1 Tax=Micromonospora sp. NPDC007271 TaxID=3154587 RepID=UPI0033C26C23